VSYITASSEHLDRMRLSHIIPVAVLALAAGLSAAPAQAATSGTWTVAGSMNTARFDDTSTLLPSGEVLVAGGSLANSALTTAELYSPATGQWAFTGSMHVARAGQTATLLPGGKVLVSGGGSTPSSAELYNPATGTRALSGSLHTNRGGQTATLLSNGKVLVAGGTTGSGSALHEHRPRRPDGESALRRAGASRWRGENFVKAQVHRARERRPVHALTVRFSRRTAAAVESS
jgi:Kelch motif